MHGLRSLRPDRHTTVDVQQRLAGILDRALRFSLQTCVVWLPLLGGGGGEWQAVGRLQILVFMYALWPDYHRRTMDTAAFGGNRKLQRLELGASQDTIPCLQFLEACVWHLVMGEREVDRLNHGTTEIRTLSTVLREQKRERECYVSHCKQRHCTLSFLRFPASSWERGKWIFLATSQRHRKSRETRQLFAVKTTTKHKKKK